MLRTALFVVNRPSMAVMTSRLVVARPAINVVQKSLFSQLTSSAATSHASADTTSASEQKQASPSEVNPSAEALELARKILTSPEFFDQPQLNKKAKQEAIETFRRHPVDTGSSEVQVAVLSERILRLQQHFEQNKKDIHSRRGLMELMQRRRKLLLYMASKDPEAYVRVIEKYQIREGKGSSRVSDRPEDWSPPRNKEDVSFRPKTWLEFKAGAGKDVKRKA